MDCSKQTNGHSLPKRNIGARGSPEHGGAPGEENDEGAVMFGGGELTLLLGGRIFVGLRTIHVVDAVVRRVPALLRRGVAVAFSPARVGEVGVSGVAVLSVVVAVVSWC